MLRIARRFVGRDKATSVELLFHIESGRVEYIRLAIVISPAGPLSQAVALDFFYAGFHSPKTAPRYSAKGFGVSFPVVLAKVVTHSTSARGYAQELLGGTTEVSARTGVEELSLAQTSTFWLNFRKLLRRKKLNELEAFFMSKDLTANSSAESN